MKQGGTLASFCHSQIRHAARAVGYGRGGAGAEREGQNDTCAYELLDGCRGRRLRRLQDGLVFDGGVLIHV